jgi:Trypsin-co-occurring domain 2
MLGSNSLKIDDIVLGSVILLLGFLLVLRHWKVEQTSNSNNPKLGVADLIEQVKNDLESMDQKRIDKNEAPLFNVETFDLEINFVVRESQSGEVKGEYQVVTVGGRSEFSAEKIQKIVLHLKTAEPGREGSVKASEDERQ